MSDGAKDKLRAAVVFIAPVVLLVGFFYQPYISDFTDTVEFGEEVAAGSTRWLWSQTVIALSVVLTILAIFSIRIYLRDAGEDLWSFLAVPLVTVGAATFVFVLGFAGLAGWTVTELGGSVAGVAEFFDEVGGFGDAIFIIGGILFGLGLLSLAAAVKLSGTLADSVAWLVVIALVVNVIAGFIPTGWGTYVIGVTAIVALWPIAYQMWQDASAELVPTIPSAPMG